MEGVYHSWSKWQPRTFLLHQPNGQYGCQRQDGYDKILSLAQGPAENLNGFQLC